MDTLLHKATKSLQNLPIQYYAYIKQSNPKFFPGNYFTIPETINRGLEFLEGICSKSKFPEKSSTEGLIINVDYANLPTTTTDIFSSVICLEILSDLESTSKSVLLSLKKLIRLVLKIAPFSFTGIQEILERDISSAALITWILMKEQVLTKHASRYLARLVIQRLEENPQLDPITSVNVMRLLYQVGLQSETTEDFLLESLESKTYLEMGNCCSPDAFLYYLSGMTANCPTAKAKFEKLLRERLEERIGERAERPLDSSMRILAFEAMGLLESPKIRNKLDGEFTNLKDLQGKDGSWSCASWAKNSLFWAKGMGIGVNLLQRDLKVITSAFALKAVHVFHERRKRSLVVTSQAKPHLIS